MGRDLSIGSETATNKEVKRLNFRLNGKQVELPPETDSVEELLKHYNLQNRIAVVEVNKEIVKKEDYQNKRLSNGDVIEIIHFVGGG
jgi:sulfur carrier protein